MLERVYFIARQRDVASNGRAKVVDAVSLSPRLKSLRISNCVLQFFRDAVHFVQGCRTGGNAYAELERHCEN